MAHILEVEFGSGLRSFEYSAFPAAATADKQLLIEVFGALRLRNRVELIELLGLDDSVTDEMVVATGWHRWRTRLADHLRGAFALVILDRAFNTIYAARDVFGQEPLFLGTASGRWVFGDSPSVVRNALGGQPVIDRLTVADFLVGHVVERDRTFFAGIERLPAAHWTLISSVDRTTQSYWSVRDAPHVAKCDDQHLRFRELFDKSVSFNAGNQENIGVFVSGGMDSSSVLASLSESSIPGRRIVGLTRSYKSLATWSDGHYIDLLNEALDFQHFDVPSASLSPLDGLEAIVAVNDGPVSAYGFAANLPLYQRAQAEGCRVILDGHGGDEIVSLGIGLLNELAQRKQWLRLWSATEAPARMYGGSRLKWFRAYLMHIRSFRFVRNILRELKPVPDPCPEASILSPDLEAAIDPHRYNIQNPFSSASHTERDLHEFVLGSPIQQYSQELLVLVGRAFGVECRMPFLDRDLAEFSLSLPADSKLKNGLTRAILREAMAGSLPQELLQRPDKFDFSDAFVQGLIHDRVRLLQLTDPAEHDLGPFVNVKRLEELRTRVIMAPETIDTMTARTLFRVAQLSVWLKSLN